MGLRITVQIGLGRILETYTRMEPNAKWEGSCVAGGRKGNRERACVGLNIAMTNRNVKA